MNISTSIETLDVPTLKLESPILIFGGPYSNLEATAALKSIADQRGISPHNTICTGDVVAYCGNPEETVNLIREWGCHVVMGNCEESVGFEKDDCGCGFDEGSVCATLSVDWYRYCVTNVSSANKEWMRTLPRQINFELGGKKFAVVHGSPANLSDFVFESSDSELKGRYLESLKVDCIVGGHCGIPFGQHLEQGSWLNAGVIGMPANDGQSSTWYMLIEQNKGDISARWHQLSFNTGMAQEAMSRARLPEDYRISLGTGTWPSLSVLPEQERSLMGQPFHPAPHQLSE